MTEKSWIEEKYKDIEYNLKTIREEIAKAAALSGRSEKDIDFMAVTKPSTKCLSITRLTAGLRPSAKIRCRKCSGKSRIST